MFFLKYSSPFVDKEGLNIPMWAGALSFLLKNIPATFIFYSVTIILGQLSNSIA